MPSIVAKTSGRTDRRGSLKGAHGGRQPDRQPRRRALQDPRVHGGGIDIDCENGFRIGNADHMLDGA